MSKPLSRSEKRSTLCSEFRKLFRAGGDETKSFTGEAFLRTQRNWPETIRCSDRSHRAKGNAIMLDLILNAIYRQSLHAALPGIQIARR